MISITFEYKGVKKGVVMFDRELFPHILMQQLGVTENDIDIIYEQEFNEAEEHIFWSMQKLLKGGN